jgi:hypothetical protein
MKMRIEFQIITLDNAFRLKPREKSNIFLYSNDLHLTNEHTGM